MWTKEEKRENARRIMAGNIDRHRTGRKLTPEAREKAIEFAVDAWVGNTDNGTATELGIKHVTHEVFRDNE